MSRSRWFGIWLAGAVLWMAGIAWWQWDNLTLKPWTLDWTFSFWGYGPAKTQARAAELMVLPPLLVLVLGWLWCRIARRERT